MILLSTDLPQRIQDKIRKRESGCWEWMGSQDKAGYGRAWLSGRTHRVHRVVYEQLVGPIAKPILDHLCRNRCCCRPSHLVPATHRENTMALRSQASAKVNADKTCCPKCGGVYSYAKNGRRMCGRCRAARQREWKAANPEKAKVCALTWRAKNRDGINAYMREWRAANRERYNAAQRTRRTAKRGALGGVA